jgi:hypothetical protein
MSARSATILLILLTAGCDPDTADPTTTHSNSHPQASARGNPVTRWSAVAADLMVDPGPILDSRALAVLYAAIHDAVNGVERRFQPYTADLHSPGASLDAAVATAARDVLLALSSSRRGEIQAEYDRALTSVPAGPARDEGIKLGHLAARLNLRRRAGDSIPVGTWPPLTGPITRPVYVPSGEPGDYAFTPPFDAPPLGPIALFPGWGRLQPFVSDLRRHAVEGPLPLRSGHYVQDFNQIKSLGRLDSPNRTAEQTEIARFWFEELTSWTRLATDVLERNDVGAWRSARILAQVHLAMADAAIACFAAKYRFRFWRPLTAIRRADEDGNPETAPDRHWRPLLWTRPGEPPRFFTPPIPEYPSAAATISAAAAEVLIRNLGDEVSFQAVSSSLPGVTRRFRSFTQAAKENGMSRVYGGIHFQDAVDDGYRLGKAIGAEVSASLPRVEGTRP